MKILPVAIAILAIFGPLTVTAETVSVDPPSAPIAVVNSSVSLKLTAAPTSIAAGQTATYTLAITNTSTDTLTNLQATFDLPAGFTFSGGTSPSALKKLGQLTADATTSASFSLTATAAAPTGRIPLELIVQADNLAPTQTTAVVDVRAGEVLGAETLVETGTSPISFVIAGLGVITAGFFLRRRYEKI